MQPLMHFSGHQTADLTEGKVHKITEKDGTVRFAVLFPKTWEKVGEKQMGTPTIDGKMDVQFYRITAWEERELVLAAPA